MIIICLSIAGTGTFAYFTDSFTTHNVITTGEVQIALREGGNTGTTIGFSADERIMPGKSVDKSVIVSNSGSSGAWVRIAVQKQFTAASGTPLDAEVIALAVDTEKWKYENGYYYYCEELKPGESTAPLFNKITFSPSMGNEYQESTATISVYAQATQVANNGTNALDAQGWPSAPNNN